MVKLSDLTAGQMIRLPVKRSISPAPLLPCAEARLVSPGDVVDRDERDRPARARALTLFVSAARPPTFWLSTFTNLVQGVKFKKARLFYK